MGVRRVYGELFKESEISSKPPNGRGFRRRGGSRPSGDAVTGLFRGAPNDIPNLASGQQLRPCLPWRSNQPYQHTTKPSVSLRLINRTGPYLNLTTKPFRFLHLFSVPRASTELTRPKPSFHPVPLWYRPR
jgi:hypothetical protein